MQRANFSVDAHAAASGLLNAVEAVLRRLDHPALPDFLAVWPESHEAREVPSTQLPVLASMGELSGRTGPTTRGLVDLLVAASPVLEWRQTYKPEDFGQDFLDRYGWTELAGLRGPIKSERIACGFLMLGPGCNYPDHAHVAEEIYLPLAGIADWSQGGAPWRPRQPGEVIHHRSNEAHAMKTGSAPLLALYLWRGGDLAQKSTILPAT
jgi:hypothetical protein